VDDRKRCRRARRAGEGADQQHDGGAGHTGWPVTACTLYSLIGRATHILLRREND
jgi:hypothetical protein